MDAVKKTIRKYYMEIGIAVPILLFIFILYYYFRDKPVDPIAFAILMLVIVVHSYFGFRKLNELLDKPVKEGSKKSE